MVHVFVTTTSTLATVPCPHRSSASMMLLAPSVEGLHVYILDSFNSKDLVQLGCQQKRIEVRPRIGKRLLQFCGMVVPLDFSYAKLHEPSGFHAPCHLYWIDYPTASYLSHNETQFLLTYINKKSRVPYLRSLVNQRPAPKLTVQCMTA